jgi:hypothetical protein
MKVQPVSHPLAGEEIVAVQPEMKPTVDAGWRRRLNLYAGRSLSDTALTAEQRARAARLALLGEAVTPGVVTGLAIGFETQSGDSFFHLSPGLGITVTGEDVRLLQPLRVSAGDIRINAPVSVLDGKGAPPAGPLAPRKLGGTIRELDDQKIYLPSSVLVLVLQPVVGERVGDLDPADQCERDPRNEAFEDQQIVDGCRLIFYAWPTEWLPLPKDIDHWRNALADLVFTKAADLAAQGEVLPWELEGVPVGLFSAHPISKSPILDRYSVVRAGGDPAPRSAPMSSSAAGTPALWQARVQQFTEQLSQVDPLKPGWAKGFRYLPPFGPLPLNAVVFSRPPETDAEHGGLQGFFPDNVRVVAAPVPVEELDEIYRESLSLAPVDRVPDDPVSEDVQVLVPVPEAMFDPDLLVEEEVDPAFQEAIDEITDRRAEFRARRDDLRYKVDALNHALGGKDVAELPVPDPADPGDEQPAPAASLNPPEDAYGTDGAEQNTDVPALRDYQNEFGLPGGAFFSILRELDNDALRSKGVRKFVDDLQAKLDHADDRVDMGFLETQTAIYKLRQLILGNTVGTRLATSPTLATIAQGESAASTRRDLQDFLDSVIKPSSGFGVEKPAAAGPPPAAQAPPPAAHTVAVLGNVDLSVPPPAPAHLALSKELLAFQPVSSFTAVKPATFSFASPVGSAVSKLDVLGQTPIVGRPLLFRTVSIAQRLQDPPSAETYHAALATKQRVVSGFLSGDLFLMVADLALPGLIKQSADPAPTFEDVRKKGMAAEILKGTYDPVRDNADEADFFSAAVKALDDATAVLRIVEGRLQVYRDAVERGREVIGEVTGFSEAARTRLQYVDKKLAEARHDLTVAQALLEEEKARVLRVNDRRKDTLQNHVTFLVYHRVRTADRDVDVPVRPLELPPLLDPLPVCRSRQIEPPPELRTFVGLLREAPLRWFRKIPPLLERLDRLDVLHNAILSARSRATVYLGSGVLQATPVLVSAPPPARAMMLTINAHREIIGRNRFETAQLDLTGVVQQSWRGALDVARRYLTIGDLLDIPHGRVQVAQLSAQELEQITQVAACLYATFGEVLPAVRLDWAERLSEFDQAVDLRRLSTLPRWEEIDRVDRRDLQGMVDWLFQRIQPDEPDAAVAMSDLVRVALLLASHAPVDQIIAALVAEETTAKVGGSIKLHVDPAAVRIGMHVLLFNGATQVGRAVLEDVASGSAMARVVDAYQPSIKLSLGDRVHIVEPPVAVNVLSRGK